MSETAVRRQRAHRPPLVVAVGFSIALFGPNHLRTLIVEFVDDIVAERYDQEEARGQIFASFAILAVVIGCLRLFGSAPFTAERRTRRAAFGRCLARARDIVRLLIWQFSRPVIIANLIAWPLAWWLIRDWLTGSRTGTH